MMFKIKVNTLKRFDSQSKPDKLNSMVSYTDGHLLYSHSGYVYYMKVKEYIEDPDSDSVLSFSEQKGEISSYKITDYYNRHHPDDERVEHIFRGFIDAGDDTVALLMEQKEKHTLDFVRITTIDASTESVCFDLQLCGISAIEFSKKLRLRKEIVKVRSVIKKNPDP